MISQSRKNIDSTGEPGPSEFVEHSRHSRDTFFLETLDALADLGADSRDFAHRHGLLLLKPDAAVTGAMRPTIAWLLQHGYRVVAARSVRLTYLHLRALWYFNWDVASPARRRLADQLAGISHSLVLVLAHQGNGLPVSVRLTADKGPADPAQRVAGQLRWVLGLGTYLLNQVHSADDPDDVLRELSIYFPLPELMSVLGQSLRGQDRSPEAIKLAEEIESSVDRKSGNVAEVQQEVCAQLAWAGRPPQTGAEWLAALCEAQDRGAAVDPWHRLVLESAYLPMRRMPEQRGPA